MTDGNPQVITKGNLRAALFNTSREGPARPAAKDDTGRIAEICGQQPTLITLDPKSLEPTPAHRHASPSRPIGILHDEIIASFLFYITDTPLYRGKPSLQLYCFQHGAGLGYHTFVSSTVNRGLTGSLSQIKRHYNYGGQLVA